MASMDPSNEVNQIFLFDREIEEGVHRIQAVLDLTIKEQEVKNG
jgi:hypothetical protein